MSGQLKWLGVGLTYKRYCYGHDLRETKAIGMAADVDVRYRQFDRHKLGLRCLTDGFNSSGHSLGR